MNPNDWRHQAACRDEDPELFFPHDNNKQQLADAKAVCQRCPSMEQCGQWALENRLDDGVWGGLSEAERRSIRRRGTQPEPAKREPAKCGTRGGYERHVHQKTRICDPCRAANSAGRYRQQQAA